jgi:hypothetical protein
MFPPMPNTGAIRSELEAVGKPIGGNDLLIAAHAHATGATIVTANVDEFERIRGLKLENWLACERREATAFEIVQVPGAAHSDAAPVGIRAS